MSAEFLDTDNAIKQLNLYFEPASVRACLLIGVRGKGWEDECCRVIAKFRAELLEIESRHLPGVDGEQLNRLLETLQDIEGMPSQVLMHGLRPELAGLLLANTTRLQAYISAFCRSLEQHQLAELSTVIARHSDSLTLPIARLAAHVSALCALYDLIMVRPILRLLEDWLFIESSSINAEDHLIG